jgi:hypothetical protein
MMQPSFWGQPTFEARDAETARHVEAIRELTKNRSPERTLAVATSSLKAIALFVVDRFGAREAMALLDSLRNEIMGMRQ